MKKLSGIKLLLLAFALSACSIGSPDATVAEQVAEGFYQSLFEKDYEAAMAAYSSKRDEAQWRFQLENVAKSLGDLQSYKLQHTEVNTTLSGRFYILDYQTTYSSGKQPIETLTIFNKMDEDETKIVSHSIAAEGFESSL